MTEEQLPSTFTYDASADFEDMDDQDTITPRLLLAQALSPIVQDDNAKAGDVFTNQGSQIIIPKGTEKDVVFLAWWKEWIEWNPDRGDKVNRILGRSTDKNSKLALRARRREMVTNSDGKEVPAVQDVYNVVSLVPEISYTDPFLISFSRTNFKVWKRFINYARGLKWIPPGKNEKEKLPIFAAAYSLSTAQEERDGNRWYEYRIGPAEFITDTNTLNFLAKQATDLRENIEHMKEINSAADSDSNLDDQEKGPSVDASAAAGI